MFFCFLFGLKWFSLQVQLKVKEILKKLSVQDIDKVVLEDFTKLALKCNHSLMLSAFFEEYANDKIPEVEKRLEIPYKLTSQKIVTREEFLKEFTNFLNKSWEISSDVPFLKISLARIFFFFRKQEILKFSEIEIHKNEDFEDVVYFFKEFIEESYKILKNEVKNIFFDNF